MTLLRPPFRTSCAVLIAAVLSAASLPAAADPGRGHGRDNGAQPHRSVQAGHCPPGLAKKSPRCVPPGQARQAERAQTGRPRVGDMLRAEDFALIRDPRRYNLQTRDGSDYYRDGDRAYRVDPETRRILAVVNLIDAFSN